MKGEEVALAGSSPDPTLKLCSEIAAATIAGLLPDPTLGANHYYSITLTTPPVWAIGRPPLVTLGRQHFYNVP